MKKVISVFLAAVVLTVSLSFGFMTVYASQSGDFTYEVIDDYAYITRYTGSGGFITVPAQLDGIPVKAITHYTIGLYNYGAFENCLGLTGLTVSNGIKEIGDLAFQKCANLLTVSIPVSVERIGNNAFFGCSGLTGADIPNSVTKIGWGAFKNCARLSSVTLPAGIDGLDAGTFEGCTLLTSLLIPSNVKIIGTRAFFNCTGLSAVSISGGVTDIGQEAFWNCNQLQSVDIPGTVVSIGQDAFARCSKLATLTFQSGVGSIGKQAFIDCVKLTALTIPGSVVSIGENAFKNCTTLTDLTLLPGVQNIGSNAFYQCSSLVNLSLPGSVATIGDSAFSGCSQLSVASIPEGVQTIGAYAFHSCKVPGTVTLPATASSIGTGVFINCSGLTNIIISNANPNFICEGFVLYNKSKTVVYNCLAQVSGHLVLPDTVVTVNDSAFRYTGLTQVTLPTSLRRIERMAFANTGLSVVVIPDGVEYIGYSAFYKCTSMYTAVVPPSVTSMDSWVFDGCTSYMFVYCQKGSYAETYAINYGLNRLTFLPGIPYLCPDLFRPTAFDYQNHFICGLYNSYSTLDGQLIKTGGVTLQYVYSSGSILGTGSVVNVMRGGELLDSYQILRFGDLNGDSNIDTGDAGIVVDYENFLLNWDPADDAVLFKAGDLNGDGNVDTSDAGIIVDYENFLMWIDQQTGIAEPED